jgi:copper transport protein
VISFSRRSRPSAAFIARLGLVGAIAVAVLLGSPASALAHATLVRADPAVNGRLRACPTRVRLEFNEAIEPAMAGASIMSADGRHITLAVSGDPHDVHAVIASLTCLAKGAYHVAWRVVSEDGHPVDGSYAFTVGAGVALDTSMTGMVMSAHDSAMTAEGEGMMHHESANWGASVLGAPVAPAILRGLALGALLSFTGLLFFLTGAPAEGGNRATRVTRWLALLTPLLLIAHFASWVVNTHAQHMLNVESVDIAASTGMGHRELLRIGCSMLALWAFSLARRPKVALAAGVGAVLVSSAIGHTAAIVPGWAIPAKALHLLATAAWIGGVLWLLTLERTVVARFAQEAARVSRVAMRCVIAVAISGLAETLLFLSAPGDLAHTPYGLIVLAKIVGTLILIGFGVHHRRRGMPQGGEGVWSPERLATTLRGEIAVMMLVILLGGLLSYVPPPQSMPSMIPPTTGP